MGFDVVVIPADDAQPCRLEHIETLEQMQQLVDGWVEAVNVDTGRLTNPELPAGVDHRRLAMLYCNEEYRFRTDLGHNRRASLLYPWAGGIGGDAFVCGPPSPEGDETDVPQAVRFFFLQD